MTPQITPVFFVNPNKAMGNGSTEGKLGPGAAQQVDASEGGLYGHQGAE